MNNKTPLANEREFRYSIKTLAKMYDLREREAVETAWSDELRESILDDSDAAIRHVERQVIDYILAHHGQASTEPEASTPAVPDAQAASGILEEAERKAA